MGDSNGDGRMDAAASAINAGAELWINQSPGRNHWLDLELVGTRSNRDGVEARIKIVTKDGAVIQTLQNIPANQLLKVTEPAAGRTR